MSDVDSIYRARIFPRGVSSTAGSPALTLDVDTLAGVPEPGGQSVRPLKGEVADSPYTLRLIDDEDAITAEFGDSDRPAMLSRLISVERSDDDGQSWTVLDVGRISSFGEDSGPGAYAVQVSSENWAARRARIFEKTDNIQLVPFGLVEGFGPPGAFVRPAGEATWIASVVSETNAVFLPVPLQARRPEALDLARRLFEDVKTSGELDLSADAGEGNFRSLRFHVSEVDGSPNVQTLEVLGFGKEAISEPNIPGSVVGPFRPDNAQRSAVRLGGVWIRWPSHGLSQGTPVLGALRFSADGGLPVSEETPGYVGGLSGVHLGELIVDVLEGEHGGNAVRIESTSRAALIAADLPKVWLRPTKPEDRGKWLQRNAYRPLQQMPLPHPTDGLRLVDFRLPQGLDPDTLPLLDSDTVRGHVWDNMGREAVNRIETQWRTLLSDRMLFSEPEEEEGTEQRVAAIDGLAASSVRTETEGDEAAQDLGDKTLEQSVDLVMDLEAVRGLASRIDRGILDIYQDGPVVRRLRADAITLDIQAGDLVRIDCTDLEVPNPVTEARTGVRIARVLEAQEGPSAYTIKLLDFGPALQPLAAPTVSVSQDSGDEDFVEVTVSGLSSGEVATVEVAGDDSDDPLNDDEFTEVRGGLGNDTHRFFLRRSGGHVHARARAEAPGRIRSSWTTDTAALAARALLDSARVTLAEESGSTARGTPVVTAETDGTTSGVRVHYAVHDPEDDPDLDESEDFATAGIEAGAELDTTVPAGKMISLRVVPYPTFSGGEVSGDPGPGLTASREWVAAKEDEIGDDAVSGPKLAPAVIIPDGKDLRSEDFATGAAGWQIASGGNVEFQDGRFRGRLGLGNLGFNRQSFNEASDRDPLVLEPNVSLVSYVDALSGADLHGMTGESGWLPDPFRLVWLAAQVESLTVKNQSTSVSPIHQFTLPGEADFVIEPGTIHPFIWIFGAWRLVGSHNRNTLVIDLENEGDFTGGEVRLARIGDMVTLTAESAPTHASAAVANAGGIIPAEWRPSSDAMNIYDFDDSVLKRVTVSSGGTLTFLYRNWSGSTAAQTSAGVSVTLTYNLEP